MRKTKWGIFLTLSVLTALGITSGVTTPTQYQAAMSLRQAERDGQALFHSTQLGTNGLSCDSCHVDGGRFSHRLKGQRIPSLVKAKAMFPAINPSGNVTTLGAQINQCIIHNLHGNRLSLTSRKLGLFDLYLRHLSRFHER